MALVFSWSAAAPAWSVEVGKPAPDFTLRSLEGEPLRLSAFRGKRPVLLYFWATWCSKCKGEWPKLNRIASDSDPTGLFVIAINVGVNDSATKTAAYQKKYGLTFPVAFDQRSRITRSFDVWGVPTVLIIDKSGIVRFRGAGMPGVLDGYVEELWH